ncbi:MAG: hypothetical protein ACON39_04980 [Coraliomargaritaceae bacterium]
MKKKRPRYRFKYLLYPKSDERFTLQQATELANSAYERNMLIEDLSKRSEAYRKKVLAQLERYPEILEYEIGRIRRLRIKTKKRNVVKFRTKRGGTVAPPATVTIYRGGAPSLGKRS